MDWYKAKEGRDYAPHEVLNCWKLSVIGYDLT